ncbi:hypothetical protein SAMN02745166_05134 [Prosthecobacter debontii]|uniref:Uncharacterized protein n=1 Tax=Prosthecobacter debontii TaxID=48467 RepID=A0A1T4Z654_9BACT|nr:hypothetical protein SAMN02745166_05134 [Prosthecobacter debontii]
MGIGFLESLHLFGFELGSFGEGCGGGEEGFFAFGDLEKAGCGGGA